MPTTLDLSKVLGVHTTDSERHAFERFASGFSRTTQSSPERLRCRISFGATWHLRLWGELAPSKSVRGTCLAKLDMFPYAPTVTTAALRLLALVAVGGVLTGCGPVHYPDQPKIDSADNFHDRALDVQKWAENSCFYNPAGVADLAGVDGLDATYGQMEDALWQWFDENVDSADGPTGNSYRVAVQTGCALGLDRGNG